MEYKFLPENLRAHADGVAEFLRNDRGIARFKAETAIPLENSNDDLEYVFTLHGKSSDGYIVAVEVQDKPDSNPLDGVVLRCVNLRLPLKLFIAFPESVSPISHKIIDRAHEKGLGVIEIRSTGAIVAREALPLSLLAYKVNRLRFPKAYRSALADAENTYRDGSAPKACALVYDEIEAISREIVKKTKKKKMWRKLRPNEKAPKVNIDNDPWEKILGVFADFYIVNKKKALSLTKSLIARISAVTGFRNESGHKPKSIEARSKRDQELRTRFESAVDLLFDLVTAKAELK